MILMGVSALLLAKHERKLEKHNVQESNSQSEVNYRAKQVREIEK